MSPKLLFAPPCEKAFGDGVTSNNCMAGHGRPRYRWMGRRNLVIETRPDSCREMREGAPPSAAPPTLKTPVEPQYPWDYLKLAQTIPADEAFRPLDEGGSFGDSLAAEPRSGR
jgi:hypothetical protein